MHQTCPTDQQAPGPRATCPREAQAPSLTVHRGHKRQVENLPHQHLHEANLQGKNENSAQATAPRDPTDSSRPRPVAHEEGAELLRGHPGGGSQASRDSRTTELDSAKAHLQGWGGPGLRQRSSGILGLTGGQFLPQRRRAWGLW